jgi:hypothetical protein
VSKISKRRVRGIAIFIVFLALAATILQFQRSGAKTPSYSFRESQNRYNAHKSVNKAKITFSTSSTSEAQSGIDQIMSQKGKRTIYKETVGSFGAYIFTIDKNELSAIADELRNIGSVISQVEQVDTALVNLDFESESARLASYEKEQADLDLVRFPSDAQNRRKEALHALIQQSRSNLDKLQDADNVLLYLTISPVKSRLSMLDIVKTWTLRYFSWLGILTVATILIYFGSKMLMYFLALMGVKGFSTASMGSYSYGGSYRNYRGYSSGYGKKNRKVKRIYKDKADSSKDEEESK